MSTAAIIRKASGGRAPSAAERSRLTPVLLAQLAMGGRLELTAAERRRLSKSALVQLAIAGKIVLTRQERDRLNHAVLGLLAAGGYVRLRPDEFGRLPRSTQDLLNATPRRPLSFHLLPRRRRAADGAKRPVLGHAVIRGTTNSSKNHQ